MHKYWGKKPANNLAELISKYSKEGDVVLDPFSGYGVFCCEAFILNRNVIGNDLNPIANFLNDQLLEEQIDTEILTKNWKSICREFEPYIKRWYSWKHDGEIIQLITVLRNKNNTPLKGKFRVPGSSKSIEIELDPTQIAEFVTLEDSYEIKDWYPLTALIENSRISAKKGMQIADLFTKRTLACHARLLSLIDKHSSGNENKLLKVAFTSNLANCSRLVPPIKSRGPMAPGAWMTGFYTGETYLENNVLHYFNNRVSKIIKGKQDFLSIIAENRFLNSDSNSVGSFKSLQNDAKNIELESNSVDYIFTDPPYGEAVPYFEQSILWNAWLKFHPDYENEIVVSDSKKRTKNTKQFEIDIDAAFREIHRVLKPNRYFSLTYHSLSGLEWKAITNACINNNFELVDFEWLVQKSFTPRQLNRTKTIKGDALVTLKKTTAPLPEKKTDKVIHRYFTQTISSWITEEPLDTNDIFLKIMKLVFKERIIITNVDILAILVEKFNLNESNKWVTT